MYQTKSRLMVEVKQKQNQKQFYHDSVNKFVIPKTNCNDFFLSNINEM